MSKLVLGIDPGNARCGWGLVKEDEGGLSLVACWCVETPKDSPAGERLASVYEGIRGVIAEYKPDCMSMEKLFFNRNITSAIAVAEARGVVLLAACQADLPVFEYTPLEIKETVVGDGKAKKNEVGQMVVLTLGLKKKPTPDDTADAVAVAITHHFWGDLR